MAKKALVAMSGGVDSSVAAACMVEAGYECLGVTMRLHDYGTTCGAVGEAKNLAKPLLIWRPLAQGLQKGGLDVESGVYSGCCWVC